MTGHAIGEVGAARQVDSPSGRWADGMRGNSLSIEAWLGVAVICAWFVRMCLGVIGRHLRYEAQLRDLKQAAEQIRRDQVRRLRALQGNIIEVEPIDEGESQRRRAA